MIRQTTGRICTHVNSIENEPTPKTQWRCAGASNALASADPDAEYQDRPFAEGHESAPDDEDRTTRMIGRPSDGTELTKVMPAQI